MYLFKRLFPLAAALIIGLTGCSKTTEPENQNFSLSYTSNQNLSKVQADTLHIDTVKILLRDIKLKQANEDSVDLKFGPFVIYLALENTVNTVTVNSVPAGTYKGVDFHVHKLEGNVTPPDPDFKEGENESQRYSVIVKGSFNGTPFVYKSKKSAKQKVTFDSPITVDEDLVNVTLVVSPYTWFYKNGNFLDPLDSANENDIDNLIKDSFKKAFKDNNKDGQPDN